MKCHDCDKEATAYFIEDPEIICCNDHLVGDYFREIETPS